MQETRRRGCVAGVCERIENRLLLCSLHFDPTSGLPWNPRVEQRAQLLAKRNRSPLTASIVWVNRGLASDGFDAAFGTSAAAGRAVVDQALADWERVITSWNRSDGTITLQVMVTLSGNSYGGSAAPDNVAPADGKPRTGTIFLGAGSNVQGDPNDSNGWYFDPVPGDSTEFTNVSNAFSASSGSVPHDFYSVVSAEATHVLGLISDFTNDGNWYQGYLLEASGYASNTGIADDSGFGNYWVFDGPTVSHLMTSYNSGNPDAVSWGNIIHSAGSGDHIVYASRDWYGTHDTGNAVASGSHRVVPGYVLAHVLADAYGYSIVDPATFGTFYANLNRTNGVLTVQDDASTLDSDDVITIDYDGSNYTVSVDLGTDEPGTGQFPNGQALPPWVSTFSASEINSITINCTDDHNTIHLNGTEAPVTIRTGNGDSTTYIGGGDIDTNLRADVTLDGEDGNDTLILEDDSDGVGGDDYRVEIGSVTKNTASIFRVISYTDCDELIINGSPTGSSYDVRGVAQLTPITVNAGNANDIFDFGGPGFDMSQSVGDVDVFGNGGTDTLNFNDQNNAFDATYTVSTNNIEHAGLSPIDPSTIEVFNIHCGDGDDTIHIDDTGPSWTTSVTAGQGNDTVIAGSGFWEFAIQGDVTIAGGLGSDTIVVNDSGSTNPRDYIVTNTQTTTSAGGGAIIYSAFESYALEGDASVNVITVNSTFNGAFTLEGRGGADTFDVRDCFAGTFIAIDSGAGLDVVKVNSDGLGSAAVQLDAALERLASVQLFTGGTLRVNAGGDKLLHTNALSIAGTGKLDLNDNDMILDYPAATELPAVEAWIRTARAGGAWNGSSGIRSSTAASAGNTTLGAIKALAFKGIYGGAAQFDGQTIDNTAVLIKYTWYGDSDFSGRVDGGDYARIDAKFNQQVVSGNVGGWLNGDFDYNNKIDGADYGLIDAAFNSQIGVL